MHPPWGNRGVSTGELVETCNSVMEPRQTLAVKRHRLLCQGARSLGTPLRCFIQEAGGSDLRGRRQDGKGRVWKRGGNSNPRDKGGMWAGGGRGQSHCQTLQRHQAGWRLKQPLNQVSGGRRHPGGGRVTDVILVEGGWQMLSVTLTVNKEHRDWLRTTLNVKQGTEPKPSHLVLAYGSFKSSPHFHKQPLHNYT